MFVILNTLKGAVKKDLVSKEEKVKRLEEMCEKMMGPESDNPTDLDEAYRDGIWDAFQQAIMMVKEDQI